MGQLNGSRNAFTTLVIICCIIFNQNVSAMECISKVQAIKEGQSAQCTGYLFSPEAESSAWKATRISELQKEENEILEKRLNLYVQQSDALAKQLAKKETMEGLVRIGYFILGTVITATIASNVNR